MGFMYCYMCVDFSHRPSDLMNHFLKLFCFLGASITQSDSFEYRELGFGRRAHRKVAGYVPHDVGDPG